MSRPPSRTLRRVVDIAGSKALAAELLKVTPHDLEAYLSERREIPQKVFLAALDIVAGNARGEKS